MICFVALCFLTVASISQTQTTDLTDVSVAQIMFEVPKPGRVEEYEQGIKKHMAWHKSNHDRWTWQTWEVMTGRDTGTYIIGTFGHRWEDFDDLEEFSKAAKDDFNKNVTASLNSSSCTFYVLTSSQCAPKEHENSHNLSRR